MTGADALLDALALEPGTYRVASERYPERAQCCVVWIWAAGSASARRDIQRRLARYARNYVDEGSFMSAGAGIYLLVELPSTNATETRNLLAEALGPLHELRANR